MEQKANVVGPNIAKFRYQRGLTQEELSSKMQLAGCYMTREILALIETQHRGVTDIQLDYFSEVLGVPLTEFFPKRPRHGGK
jgi:transcriptional regulator with XRE-family HTH domain